MTVVAASSEHPPFTIRELAGEADRALWNVFVGVLPEGDVLQAWEWAAVKSEWMPVRLAAFRGQYIAGGAMILKRSLPMVGAFYYAPRGPLLGDWSDETLLKILLDGIAARAKQDGAAFLKIDPAVPVERVDVLDLLKSHGFQTPATADAQGFGGTQPRCVMQLDLADRTEQDLLAAFKAQTRRNVKLSTDKHGVHVIGDTKREDLVEFDRLMRITGERDGFRPRGLAYFEALWDNLATVGLAKLFLTQYEGECLSGALCFIMGDKAWYVYGASSNEHRNVMPNYAMQWAMIRWAHDQGCRWYDFRGVSPRRRTEGESTEDVEKEDHLQGLNRFKEGFGSRYVEYIGELDLVYRKAPYWLFTHGKPAAQKLVRRVKGNS